MATNRRWLTKPPRPYLQGGHPLARGLVFSVCPWWNASAATEPYRIEPDDRTRVIRGNSFGSITGNHQHWDAGITISSGVSPSSKSYARSAHRSNTELLPGRQWSAAMLYRVFDNPYVSGRPMFIKGDNNSQPNAHGFRLRNNAGLNSVESYTLDGGGGNDTNDPIFNGYGGNSLGGNESFFQMTTWIGNGTFPGFAPNQSFMNVDSFPSLINPIFPNISGNANLPIQMLGNSGNGNIPEAEIAMVALWDRHLPQSAVQMMLRDPFTLWRPIDDDEAEDDEIAAVAGFLDACCCPQDGL